MQYARWANKEEIIEHTTKLTKESEVKRSGITFMYDDKNLYVNDGNAHNLVIGCTGSGKTQATTMPQIYLSIRAQESFIINDARGEMYDKFSGMAKENGYDVQVINFLDTNVGNNYNPLYIPYKLYKSGKIDDAVDLVENVGYNLLSDSVPTSADPFWIESAIGLFTGLTFYLFERAKSDEINLNSVVNLCNYIDEIKKDLDKADKTSVVYNYLSSIVYAPKETCGSIISVFKQRAKIITTRESVSKLLCNNNIDLENIKKNKTALFIIGDGKYSNIIIPMILNQIYSVSKINNDTEKRLNVILDEFESIKPIKDFIDMLSISRSLNIRLTISIRSILHLENVYGPKNTDFIKMSFGNIFYLLSNDIRTLDIISKECGRKSEHEDLITLEELKILQPFEAIIIASRMYPIRTKLLPYYELNIKDVDPIKMKKLEYNEVKLYK